MSSNNTIFPREFLIHYNRISDEERLRLELAGYYFLKNYLLKKEVINYGIIIS